MKKWNYRVVLDSGGVYRISEVYYSDEGLPTGWAESSLLGDTPEDAHLMMGAFSRPILKVTSSDAPLEEIAGPIGPARYLVLCEGTWFRTREVTPDLLEGSEIGVLSIVDMQTGRHHFSGEEWVDIEMRK